MRYSEFLAALEKIATEFYAEKDQESESKKSTHEFAEEILDFKKTVPEINAKYGISMLEKKKQIRNSSVTPERAPHHQSPEQRKIYFE